MVRVWDLRFRELEIILRQASFLFSFIAILALLSLAGCKQSVFVGMPTPAPEQEITTPVGDVPSPEIGPSTFASVFMKPGNVSAEVALQNTHSSENAFAWSETDNYLILGTDRRPNDSSWRTDTIMVVGIDRAENRIAVLSIPRDLYVEIPYYGYGRINQADYIGEKFLDVDGGGPALVSEILHDVLGISTEHWVRFEMTGFASIIDAVGGVSVHLDCPFFEPIYNLDTNQWEYFTLPAGDVHMDGDTAYWYARLRLKENDIGRSNRQRQLLWALRDQALSKNLIVQLPVLWQAFNQSYTSDLTLLDIIDLMSFGMAVNAQDVRASGITLRELDSYITEQGAAVLLITDPAKVQSVVDGVWDAAPMVNANAKDATKCEPIPTGPPAIPASLAVPTVSAATDSVQTADAEDENTVETSDALGG